jgi:hypothetical protein
VHAGAPRVVVIVPTMEPVMGAAILALEQAGVRVDADVRANLQEGNDRLVAPHAAPGPGAPQPCQAEPDRDVS